MSRLSGAHRYATAVAISQSTFTGTPVSVAYIATGLNFPDALAGGPAAALAGGPVLLVTLSGIPAPVQAELTRLQPAEIKVLGGPGVVSDVVLGALQAYTTGSVTRLAGADRYATAAAVVTDAFSGYSGPVYVAFGGNFPDALSGGPAAAAGGAPLILASASDVPQPIADALSLLAPTKFVLLGGTGVLGVGVSNKLAVLYPGVPIERWSGADRYATSAVIASNAFPAGAEVVFLATGLNFPDALAGVPAAGLAGGPLLLTSPSCLPASVASELLALHPTRVVILGGTAVVFNGAATTVCGMTP